jgi:hypothetical protein
MKKTKKEKIILWFIAAIVLSSLSGCGTWWAARKEVPVGEVAPEGPTIKAADGSFVLRPGESFEPPFVSDFRIFIVEMDGEKTYYRNQYGEGGLDFTSYQSETLSQLASEGLQFGGRRVLIEDPSLEKPLYGVLVLSDLFGTAKDSPATRSYYIQIPKQKMKQARGGRASVVYEYYTAASQLGGEWRAASWILWMSDVPF